MKTLHVSVTDKIATYQKRDGDIVCGNKHNEEEKSGYQIKFIFDSEWQGIEKKIARFIWGGQFQDVEFKGDTCPVPILSNVTLCKVGVYAGDLRTTTSASIICKPSILCKTASPTIENDKYYANEARKYAEEAKQYAEQAEAGGGSGKPGENGKTPYIQDGYWYIDGQNLGVKAEGEDGEDGKDGTTQVVPLFANNTSECTDISKLYVLPDGYIYGYINKKEWVNGSVNLIPKSTVSGGGSIYNGKGYNLGIRLNSTGAEKNDKTWCITTGFMPATKNGKNSVLRIKNWANGKADYISQTGNVICLYDASYKLLTTNQEGTGSVLDSKGIGVFDDTTDIYTVTLSDILDDDDIAFVRVSTLVTTVGQTATDDDATNVIITVDEEITEGHYEERIGWASTGHAFVPANYENRIIESEEQLINHANRIEALEKNENNDVPNYWTSELNVKADAIQSAMEKAGRNKSAFLWYTDAHWANGNAKVSPTLLTYLYRNTPMNKVNFGGDIIGDSLLATREEMKYLYEWRKAIKDLPNHHSVLGNHDDFKSESVDYESDNFTYSWLIAPEETSDMVMGGDFYYHIDNPCEKTRYLYLDSGKRSLSDAETSFVIQALTTTPNGWHIVAISHIWWLYESASTPTVGGINAYCKKILDVFDAYNARQSGSVTMVSMAHSYNFSSCGGKVEFCIGGHIHVDYDITSAGGIPIILTASDVNQNRVPDSIVDSGTLGTITESAVYGIVADYDHGKITIIGVGRGGSRQIQI